MTSVTLCQYIYVQAYLARQLWSYMSWGSHGNHIQHMVGAQYIRSVQVLCMFNKMHLVHMYNERVHMYNERV